MKIIGKIIEVAEIADVTRIPYAIGGVLQNPRSASICIKSFENPIPNISSAKKRLILIETIEIPDDREKPPNMTDM